MGVTSSPPPQPTPVRLPRVLTSRRVGLHMLFAFLLVFGLLCDLLGGACRAGVLGESRHASPGCLRSPGLHGGEHHGRERRLI